MRSALAASLLIAAAATVTGCFVPDLGDGQIACGTAAKECPTKYFCRADNYCWKTPDPADASTGDDGGAGPFDLAGADFAGCVPAMCGPAQCGKVDDKCGSTMECPGCPMGESCGGGGVTGECGCPTQTQCGSRNCGTIVNGCGNNVTICGGSCPSGQVCGGGGVNICGTKSCVPMTNVACPMPGGGQKPCGYVSDGCSGVTQCVCSGGRQCVNGMCM